MWSTNEPSDLVWFSFKMICLALTNILIGKKKSTAVNFIFECFPIFFRILLLKEIDKVYKYIIMSKNT